MATLSTPLCLHTLRVLRRADLKDEAFVGTGCDCVVILPCIWLGLIVIAVCVLILSTSFCLTSAETPEKGISFLVFLLLLWFNPHIAAVKNVVGIDLGTTYSVVGIFKNGRVEIIANDQGNRITPSYVGWTPEGERLVGEAAKNQAALYPETTIFDVKRLIGRRWDDPEVQRDAKLYPYKIINRDNKPYIQVPFNYLLLRYYSFCYCCFFFFQSSSDWGSSAGFSLLLAHLFVTAVMFLLGSFVSRRLSDSGDC